MKRNPLRQPKQSPQGRERSPLSCHRSSRLLAVLAVAVANASGIPVTSFRNCHSRVPWLAFKRALSTNKKLLSCLPLATLSYGERFALAIGLLFDSDDIPYGDDLTELLVNATGIDADSGNVCSLRALLGMEEVQSFLPEEVLLFDGLPMLYGDGARLRCRSTTN